MKAKFKAMYFQAIYDRYHKGSKYLKEKILDEFCKVCGYNRKYAIRKLNGLSPQEKLYQQRKAKRKRQGHAIYDSEVIQLLSKIWEAAGYPCSIRLKSVIPVWMPWIEKYFRLSADRKRDLLKISPRQMDRRMQCQKHIAKKSIYGGTKPGTLLKHHIPIKTDHWNVKEPGFTEIDTISHSGNNADGLFAYSVNQTDILTGWVETRAVMGKGEKTVSEAMDEMEIYYPFNILGIDADNGGEFINYLNYNRCKQKNIQFTRGRPYKKDDNAHIEQKNWTHVRKLMLWNRYDSQEAVDAMNDLYRNELHLFMNLFLPSMKLVKKERIGSKPKRNHDTPQTPLDRLIASGKGDPRKVSHYINLRAQIDPFELSKIIDKKLDAIIKLANHHHSPKGSQAQDTDQPPEKQQRNLSRQEEEVMQEISRIFEMEVKVA
jgi:hypothetical protein